MELLIDHLAHTALTDRLTSMNRERPVSGVAIFPAGLIWTAHPEEGEMTFVQAGSQAPREASPSKESEARPDVMLAPGWVAQAAGLPHTLAEVPRLASWTAWHLPTFVEGNCKLAQP